jgi:Kef-type K+ transport system membrane component KefB
MVADAGALTLDFSLIIVTAIGLSYIARLTGQPTIIAYIFTGIVLGPVFLDVVTQTELVDLMAELGLGFLLFLLGMKMRIDDIREILRPVINIAVWQTVLQTALAFAVAWMLGFTVVETTIIALATVFGATPIIVKLLTDKDEIATLPGRIDVGVLIIQDIYLVVLLALLSAESFGTPSEIAVSIGSIFLLMAGIGVFSYVSSKYLLPRLFDLVADDQEVFFIVGIAWAFLFIVVSDQLNLSIEVGAFLAGLSLAQVSYTSELTERIRPITDFFMVIFFSSIGLRLAADQLFAFWQEALIASAVLMIGNFLIMFFIIDYENFTPQTSFIGSINMIQVSEFSLVVGALAITQGYIGPEILGYLSLMAIVTMGLSAYDINYNAQIWERAKPWFARFESPDKRDVDLKTYQDHAVVIGYDEITKRTLTLLGEWYDDVVVIDRNPRHAAFLRGSEHDYVYGDFKHSELRKATGIGRAAFILSSSVERDINRTAIRESRDDAVIFVEADSVDDAIELYRTGATYVIISTLLTGQELAETLESYLTTPDTFQERVTRDLIALQSGEIDG